MINIQIDIQKIYKASGAHVFRDTFIDSLKPANFINTGISSECPTMQVMWAEDLTKPSNEMMDCIRASEDGNLKATVFVYRIGSPARGEDHGLVAVPVVRTRSGQLIPDDVKCIGPMFGGNYIRLSTSMGFPFNTMVKVFDRYMRVPSQHNCQCGKLL